MLKEKKSSCGFIFNIPEETDSLTPETQNPDKAAPNAGIISSCLLSTNAEFSFKSRRGGGDQALAFLALLFFYLFFFYSNPLEKRGSTRKRL